MQDATPLFDIWAIGVTAYRMMAGKLPFEQISDSKRELAIRNNDREPLPTIYSAKLRGLVDKLLDPD
jgi:serine/threonine protein kinase